MRRVLVMVLGLAVLLAAAYAVLLGWYDGERIRAVVSERMLVRHGIALDIEQLERSVSPRPLIRLKGVRVANAEQRDHELVEVDTASFRIHPLSLVFGSLTLDDIVVDGLRVTVPVDEEGTLYWDPLIAAASGWLHRFDWSLRHFEILNLESETRDVSNDNDFLVAARRIAGSMAKPAELALVATDVEANLETTLPLRLDGTARLRRVELGRKHGDLPVTFKVDGSIGDKSLSIRAAGENLLDGDPMARDRLQARITLDDAVATVKGTVSRDHMTHLDLFVTLDKPGKDGDPDLHVEFAVSDPATRWRLSAIRASYAESELTGDVELGNRGERRFFGGTLEVTNLYYPEEDDPGEDAGSTVAEVLPPGDLYANFLNYSRKFDADVRFRAGKSVLFGVPFEQLAFNVLFDRGMVAVAIEEASIDDATLSAAFSLVPAEGQTDLKLEASLRKAPLSALIGGIDALDGVTGEFDGTLELRATGEQTSAVLHSTAGRVVLFLKDGAMPDELATRIAGDVFSAMFEDFDEDDRTPIRCAIVDLTVEKGLARPQQMILDTGAFNLYGTGEINLAEQQIDIELVPRAKDFSLVSMRLPLRIHGAFRDISVEPDVGEAAASLITPIEFGNEEDSNCAPPPMSVVNR